MEWFYTANYLNQRGLFVFLLNQVDGRVRFSATFPPRTVSGDVILKWWVSFKRRRVTSARTDRLCHSLIRVWFPGWDKKLVNYKQWERHEPVNHGMNNVMNIATWDAVSLEPPRMSLTCLTPAASDSAAAANHFVWINLSTGIKTEQRYWFLFLLLFFWPDIILQRLVKSQRQWDFRVKALSARHLKKIINFDTEKGIKRGKKKKPWQHFRRIYQQHVGRSG